MDWGSDLDAAVARVNTLRTEGMTVKQMARAMDTTPRRVQRIIHKALAKGRAISPRAEDEKALWRRALALHREGKSRAEIAAALQVSKNRVGFYMHYARQKGAQDVPILPNYFQRTRGRSATRGKAYGSLRYALYAYDPALKDWLRAQAAPEDKTLCETLLRLVKEKCYDAR
jgi:DNA-binding CsgD family transcriptional regulator